MLVPSPVVDRTLTLWTLWRGLSPWHWRDISAAFDNAWGKTTLIGSNPTLSSYSHNKSRWFILSASLLPFCPTSLWSDTATALPWRCYVGSHSISVWTACALRQMCAFRVTQTDIPRSVIKAFGFILNSTGGHIVLVLDTLSWSTPLRKDKGLIKTLDSDSRPDWRWSNPAQSRPAPRSFNVRTTGI